MKLRYIGWMAVWVGLTAFTTTVRAQGNSGAGGPHARWSFLTEDERQKLKTAHDQALAQNPDLKTEVETLHQEF